MIRIKTTLIVMSLIAAPVFSAAPGEPAGDLSNLKTEVSACLNGVPFSMPAIPLPEFPDQRLIITDFGAVGDGHTMNSIAINQAILKCSQSGGGTVIVPPGLWLTGPIKLQSNVNLHLQAGALVVFSTDRNDYPVIKPPAKRFTTSPLITGYNLENIAITGAGVFDGNGQEWRPVKKFKTTAGQWRDLLNSGGVVNKTGDMWWPSVEALHGEDYLNSLGSTRSTKDLGPVDYLPARDFLRPNLVSLVNCKIVLVEGITFKNSPMYAFQPERSENLIIRNIKINNEWWAQNGDGIDISSCKNVLIFKCTVTAGDDAICMKSSRISGQTEPAVQNIVIRDCIVYHGHGGFVIGSNTDGGMRNIFINNCVFIGTDVGLRFKSARDRGGLVENIFIQNIRMKDIVNEAILFNTYYEGVGRENEIVPVTEDTPVFTNFDLDSIVCIGASQAIRIMGLPEMPVSKIRISNSYLAAEGGFSAEYAREFTLENISIIPKSGPVFQLAQCAGFNLNSIGFPKSATEFMNLSGKNTRDIRIRNTVLSSLATPLIFSKEVDKKSVSVE